MIIRSLFVQSQFSGTSAASWNSPRLSILLAHVVDRYPA